MSLFQGILSLLTLIGQGFLNLVLAPFKAGAWLLGILNADSRAAAAAPELEALTAKLAESGDLSAFEAVLDNQPNLNAAAKAILSSNSYCSLLSLPLFRIKTSLKEAEGK